MEIKQLDALVHFIFIWDKAVAPKYVSKRIAPDQLDTLKNLPVDKQKDFICDLCDLSHMEEKVKVIDWMVSSLSTQHIGNPR